MTINKKEKLENDIEKKKKNVSKNFNHTYSVK